MDLWNKKLLPSIKKEIAAEINTIKTNLKELNDRCMNIEKSQEFLSSKYDQIAESLQSLKKQNALNDNKMKKQEESIVMNQESIDDLYLQVDEMQQYSRRECLEIIGIPKLANEVSNQLIAEVGKLVGVEIKKEDISISHRLPDTKATKDRIIVKFVRRDKKEELYKKRSQLRAKSTKDLPSLQDEDSPKRRIHINESLTSYRRRLFGKINQFKKEHNYKYLWTANGKILLKEHEGSKTLGPFTSDVEFEEFLKSL